MFSLRTIYFVDFVDKQRLGSPEAQHMVVWIPVLKKVRETEYTLVWFCRSLAIPGSGGGLV